VSEVVGQANQLGLLIGLVLGLAFFFYQFILPSLRKQKPTEDSGQYRLSQLRAGANVGNGNGTSAKDCADCQRRVLEHTIRFEEHRKEVKEAFLREESLLREELIPVLRELVDTIRDMKREMREFRNEQLRQTGEHRVVGG
jgi:hypothetical protein